MSVEIPKLAVVLGSVTPSQGSVVEARVYLGATKEVSSWELLLKNWSKRFSPGGAYPILVGKDGHIDIGRGVNVPQIITTRTERIEYESGPSENYVRVSGRCWGEKLFRRLVTKGYGNQKGEAIVKDLLDNYAGLSHVRDSTELVEDTDTTYTRLEYENTPVWDILKYIAESADKAGVIGFDFRVAPDGKFEFFPRNSKTSPISLSEKIELGNYSKAITAVRNKITVYGAQYRMEPADGDAWTESLDNWYCETGGMYLDDADQKVGSYRIRHVPNGVARFWRTFSSISIHDSIVLKFWIKTGAPTYTGTKIRLRAPDASNYFETDIANISTIWSNKEFNLGKSFEYDIITNPNGIWTRVGTASWFNITAVEFYFTGQVDVGIIVDGLFFNKVRFRSIQEDSGSQTTYGLRELTDTDEELFSDNECMLRAKALLANLKDPAEYLTIRSTVIDYGTTPLLPGDKIHVTLPNENVDADFRILSVEYYVDARTQTLEITMELGREFPLLADYLFALHTRTGHLSRLKRGAR